MQATQFFFHNKKKRNLATNSLNRIEASPLRVQKSFTIHPLSLLCKLCASIIPLVSIHCSKLIAALPSYHRDNEKLEISLLLINSPAQHNAYTRALNWASLLEFLNNFYSIFHVFFSCYRQLDWVCCCVIVVLSNVYACESLSCCRQQPTHRILSCFSFLPTHYTNVEHNKQLKIYGRGE